MDCIFVSMKVEIKDTLPERSKGGWTQVPPARAARVQIHQVSCMPKFLLFLLNPWSPRSNVQQAGMLSEATMGNLSLFISLSLALYCAFQRGIKLECLEQK